MRQPRCATIATGGLATAATIRAAAVAAIGAKRAAAGGYHLHVSRDRKAAAVRAPAAKGDGAAQ